ncbi:MAG: flagellar hook-basal body complex protein FliE [Candidatus Eremiobacteraeota bacterium]|nr:flagellar hook-basal body complex protein FliE [Candidatus Eremiobacteraeota bacterium]
MSKIVPGTFVPDIGALSPKTEAIPDDATGAVTGASFKDTVKSFLGDVNDKVATSDQLSRDYAAGKTNDVNKVVTSVEEASLALQFTMAIRNKLMDAYTEVSRMQM